MTQAIRWVPATACILILVVIAAILGPAGKTSAGSEPEVSPTVPADWIEYRDTDRLFSIRHPRNWLAHSEEVVVFSPDDHAGTDLSVLPHIPVLVVVPQGPFFSEGASSHEALTFWLDSLRPNWEVASVEREPDLHIDGQPTGVAHVSGTDLRTGITFEMSLVACRLADGDGLIIAVAPEELWDGAWPIMRTMLGTFHSLTSEDVDGGSMAAAESLPVWRDLKLGSEGNSSKQIKPGAIAVGPDGELYVLDADQDRINVYSAEGVFLFAVGEQETQSAQYDFTSQGSLAVGPDRSIYVVDPGHGRIQKLDSRGTPERVFGAGALGAPRHVSVSSAGLVYVTDGESAKVHVFDERGQAVRQIELQSQEEQSGAPWGVAVGPEQRIYVTIPANQSLLVLDDTGDVLMSVGRQGSEAGILAWPTAVTVDEAGNIYVADTELGQVRAFDPQGQLVATLDRTESGEPFNPTDLALSGNGDLYACDSETGRVLRVSPKGDERTGVQLTNGGFEYGLAAWQTPQLYTGTAGTGEAYVYEEDSPRGHVLELAATGEEGADRAVSVYQPLDVSGSGLDSLHLTALVMVVSEEGNNIGGPNGDLAPQGAVLLRLDYRDEQGHDGYWYHGFYSKSVPDSDTAHFTTVPLETWYPYESPNLLAELPQVDTITGLQISGVGQTFIGRVDDVQLVAE